MTAMLSEAQHRFLARRRVGHLATADRAARPHVVPVCYCLEGASVYVTVDEKPKRDPRRPLRRIRNLEQNPRAALVVDRWDEDWTRLAWVMLRGPVELLTAGPEHDRAQALLRERYPQLESMDIAALPVIALRIERVDAWGGIDAAGPR